MALPLIRAHMRGFLSRIVGEPAARLLARLGLTPNMVTLLGLLLSAVTAYLVASQRLPAAGILLLISAMFDHLDGALARLTDRVTVFGAFLDSVVDRITEAVVFLGILLLALSRGSDFLVILVFLAFGLSVLVSYTRARAEGLGVPGEVGVLTRAERVVLLAVGLLAGQQALTIALGIIAMLSLVTTLQRVAYAWRGMRERD